MRCSGYSPLGIRKIERVLPINSVVTIVGELALSASDYKNEEEGNLIMRRPQGSSGRPFYITKQTLNELHSSISKVASTCKVIKLDFKLNVY